MSICTLRSSELNTSVQTYTFNRFHRGSKNHPVHQLNQNNIRLNSKIFTSLDFIIGVNLANKRGNYNASAKEMHKRSFWLSHKLNYGNMLLFVLVWRENQTAHTRTQTHTRIRDSLCLIEIKHPLPETQCWGGRHPFRHSRSSHHRLWWRENYPQKNCNRIKL